MLLIFTAFIGVRLLSKCAQKWCVHLGEVEGGVGGGGGGVNDQNFHQFGYDGC